MKKIPTLFEREFENHRIVRILPNISPDLAWVMAGEGVATIKWDGACCAVINGVFYKRYDAKHGKPVPSNAIKCQVTQSSVRRTQTLSLATCLVGYLVTELQPAINGSGMRMTEWELYRMEHMRPSAHISEQTHTTSMPMYSSPMGKTLLNWIGALKASALIWKPM